MDMYRGTTMEIYTTYGPFEGALEMDLALPVLKIFNFGGGCKLRHPPPSYILTTRTANLG